ncbi:MAG: AtpZ/AtpI family protein [Acetoanaerobium sp.]|nr:AtpZ/AtpI family protein [Acetoanaerobium sp.]
MPNEKKSFYKSLSNLALLSQIGFSMVVPIIGCVWVANFLMKKFNLGVWVLFLFIILGVFSAFANLFKITKFSSKNKKQSDLKSNDKDGD